MQGVSSQPRLQVLVPGRLEDRSARTLALCAVPHRSRSLEYGLVMLECFTAERPVLRLSELADALRISRSTAHRYASTLVQLGYLEQDEQRRYRLAARSARAGAMALEMVRREVRARSILEDLRAETGHTVSLGLLAGLRVVYVYRFFAHGTGQYEADGDVRAGGQCPALYTPVGMALFSTLIDSELYSLLAGVNAGCDAGSDEDVLSVIQEVQEIKQSGVATRSNVRGAGWVIAAPVVRWIDRPILAVELIVPNGTRKAAGRLAGRVKHTAKLISG